MSLSSTITVYHALHETGELIDNSTSGSSVLSPETLTVSDVEFGVTEYTHSLQATSISSSYFDSSETYTVYPIYAIHHGRVYYDTSNLSSVAFQYDVDNTWIVVYQRDTSVFDAITYTENADVRLWVGNNMMNLETTLIEQGENMDFFSVDISTGSMSEQYYSYGSAFSPTCNIEMTPTSDITQGKWLRVEFKVFGVWQNFGVFYVKDAPENTSEYVSISGVGALEYLSTIEVEKNYYSAISISQIVDTLATTYGVYVQFNFDVKSDNNYYTKSSIAFPCENEEVEDSDGNSTYNITEGKADYRSVLSRLAIAFCSNVVEHGGVIHIIHNNEYDYLSHTLCNVSEDIMGDEPVQRLDAYYSTESVKTSWKIMKPFEYTSGSYAPIELENSMDYTIMGSSSKYTDADKNLIYYPLKIDVDNGGFVELAYLTPSIWNVMPYGSYSMKEYCETLGLKEPFYYFPISCSVVGYTPLLHPGSCVSVEFSQGNRNVYIGNVTLSWDGGMFTMDINTPAEIDVSGVESSSIPSSTTTGASSISIGISNSIANATFLNDKVITASKIADSTITSTQISDSTITGSKIASSTIEDSNIANGTITGTKIANATITGSNLANGTITSTQIAQSTITGSNLADNTITGGKIADTTITGSKLVNGTITGTQIASSTITSSNIVDGTITGTDISSATITNSNIADTTLTGSKFVNGTITATQIADATITGSKIASSTIENTNIKDSTITGAKIVDATITADKIDVEDLVADSGFISELTTNTTFTNYLGANYMEVGFANMDTANIDKANIGILLNEVGLITSATISQGHVTGYLDAVEVNANKITAGTLVADRIAIRGSTSSIVYALNNDGTVTSQEVDTINGSAITERTITADHIVAHSITANELTTANISSPNGYINFSTGYINIGGHLVYDANGFYLDVADELEEKIDQVADGSLTFYLTQEVDTSNATTTVTAHVWRAGVDATDEFSSEYFKWYKKDDNSLEYLSYGYSVTVDNEDFDYSGSVICKFLPTVSNLVVSGSNLVVSECNLVLYDPNGEITPSPSGGIDPEDVGDISNAIYNSTMSASSGTSITEVE